MISSLFQSLNINGAIADSFPLPDEDRKNFLLDFIVSMPVADFFDL